MMDVSCWWPHKCDFRHVEINYEVRWRNRRRDFSLALRAWNKKVFLSGLTQPRYPGNSMGELCYCSRLHGDWSVCVYVCKCVIIKSNTGFLPGNRKVHDFTRLCWGLEMHGGRKFSSQRKVYVFCSKEYQQPWSCLQRVRWGWSSKGMHIPEGKDSYKWSQSAEKSV